MFSTGAGSLAARKRKAKKEEVKDEGEGKQIHIQANNTTECTTYNWKLVVYDTMLLITIFRFSFLLIFLFYFFLFGCLDGTPKTTPALLRIQKDLTDLEIPDMVELKQQDDYNLSFIITPQTGKQ